jgi:menaquinone-dependent protoporphyrinogen oxidase
MTRILVAYATTKGSTREVAQAVSASLRQQGLTTETRPAAEVDDITPYDGVVLGGALYMGRWHSDARRFLKRHRETLAELPVAVFGLGPLTLKERDVAGSRKQLDRALAKVPEVEPFAVAVFGGVVDPTNFRFPFNRMPRSDARDWDAIAAWAGEIAEQLAPRTTLAV